MDAFGIAQVGQHGTGVHLSWSGPSGWVYAPGGWTIRRRPANPERPADCERLEAPELTTLRAVRQRRLRFGSLTLRDGRWLTDLDGAAPPPGPAELFRVEFDARRRVAGITVIGKLSFAVALCDGRAVAVSGPREGTAVHTLRAARIDTVVAVCTETTALTVCAGLPEGSADEGWQAAKVLAEGLTLPFRELMPALADEADELAEARHRLLPGETIDDEAFTRLAAVLRPVLRAAGPPRPADLALLLREEPRGDADEVRGLDPLRVMLAHPAWRRALGFAWFDDDPSLVPGQVYEYRISAALPGPDVTGTTLGFATVPSGTLLPADFYLGNTRVRLAQPAHVRLTPGTHDDEPAVVTRRGVKLAPGEEPFWTHPPLDGWSLVADFPAPVSSVALDTADGHDLHFATELDLNALPVPPDGIVKFTVPVRRLLLRGTGFLHTLRTPATGAPAEVAALTPPIKLTDTPPPKPPVSVRADGLQTPQPAPVGMTPGADVEPRHELGFAVRWRPTPAFGLTAWPTDLDAAPPLDAAVFQVERREEPAGPWVPVVGDDDLTLGERGGAVRDLGVAPGSDVLAAFPENAVATGGTTLDLSLIDVFASAGTPPEPGTTFRYRVRAMDAVGRPGEDWKESDPARLEKHAPPPLPVGPGPAIAGEPAGVAVRVLVRGAPDLTPAESGLLGGSSTAVVVRWGWHAEQREQDPYTAEFRLYATPPLDTVPGQIVGVTRLTTGPVTSYRVDLVLDRPIAANASAGRRLDAGHPFLIRSHTGGTAVQMIVETRLRIAGTVPTPVLGPVLLARPLTPELSRPPAWGPRIAVLPVTDDTEYEVVLRDMLVLDQDHPAAALWVGVSAADAQAYVADQLAPVENRPGNESAIVAVNAAGRYHGRPPLEIPPPLGAVPVARTPEPGAEPVHFPLDLTPYLPTAALATGLVRAERTSAVALLASCSATSDGRILGRPVEPLRPGDADAEIPIGNPEDAALLAAALRSGRTALVEDRFLVHLAARHPYRDRLFEPAHQAPLPPGPFPETLPPAAERWIYRVRAVDRAGHVSVGSATARVVVRVPSLVPGAAPVRAARLPDDPAELVRVHVPPDPAVTHALVFTAPVAGPGPVTTGEVIRVPNRPDLPVGDGLWLRAPDGELLTPTATPLDAPGTVVEPDGTRSLAVNVPGIPGAWTRVWLATLTVDRVPSPLTGPFSVFIPPVPSIQPAGTE